jgi:formylglycine-generating enzyme required for sulfatase activity
MDSFRLMLKLDVGNYLDCCRFITNSDTFKYYEEKISFYCLRDMCSCDSIVRDDLNKEVEILKKLSTEGIASKDTKLSKAVYDFANLSKEYLSNPSSFHEFKVAINEYERMEVIKLMEVTIFVEGGSFMMGATKEQGNDAYSSEKPVCRVTVGSYYIGQYPVTQKQWKAIMETNPSRFQIGENYPVENVSWLDAQKFIWKLNQKTGRTYRLPTEIEWEYAARGGNMSEKYKYSGSNDPIDVAWFKPDSANGTMQVGQKHPNELGIYDMSGNVWEWCEDFWCDNYNSGAQRDSRVVRGGSWENEARSLRISSRYLFKPDIRSSVVGFRLVLNNL